MLMRLNWQPTAGSLRSRKKEGWFALTNDRVVQVHELGGGNVQEIVLSDGRRWTVVMADEESPHPGLSGDAITVEGSEVWLNIFKDKKRLRIRLA